MLILCTFDETDVAWMKGADETLSLPLYLDVLKQLDGRMDVEMIWSTDARIVEQVVFGEPFLRNHFIDD